MSVVIDSDILIEVTRGNNAEVLHRWADLGVSDSAILCSVISVAELWHGARPSEQEALQELFDSLLCIAVDMRIAQQAGEFLRKYHRSHGLKIGDAIIAASAAVNDATLWTRNTKHYPMPSLIFF